jgi:Fe-S-cluster-containing dehydrogenase component
MEGNEKEYTFCSYCGETYADLETHIPKCSGSCELSVLFFDTIAEIDSYITELEKITINRSKELSVENELTEISVALIKLIDYAAIGG